MLLISHRGNISGINPETENNPKQIKYVLGLGFGCEIDVWIKNGKYFLGHDKPIYPIDKKFLEHNRLWCHAKNINAFQNMLKNPNIHCFWHENDKVVLTSLFYLWSFPSKLAIKGSIAVLPEIHNTNIKNCIGVCSDFIINYEYNNRTI